MCILSDMCLLCCGPRYENIISMMFVFMLYIYRGDIASSADVRFLVFYLLLCLCVLGMWD